MMNSVRGEFRGNRYFGQNEVSRSSGKLWKRIGCRRSGECSCGYSVISARSWITRQREAGGKRKGEEAQLGGVHMKTAFLFHLLWLFLFLFHEMDSLDTLGQQNTLGSLHALGSDPYFAECLIKYRTYEFEFVPGFSMQLLPNLFLADFYNEMPTIVRLLDPLGSVFVISIKQRPSRVYLDHGSARIGEVYNLFSGGWITLKFVQGDTFEMLVRDRMWKQVTYPFPPQKFGLGEPGLPMSVIDEEEDEFLFVDAIHFYHALVKDLSIEETNTPFLFLHIGFCEFAFSPTTTSITLVNFRGRKWNCKFQWNSSKPGYCCVSDGWATFRGLNGLLPGTSLKLGVAKKNRKYLFVRVVKD